MLLSCLAVLLSCRLAAGSYPLKGRYGRSMTAAWPPLPVYYPPRAARPLYYPESEYYYPQEAFYYPAVDKYPVYQSVIPSYYVDQQRPYYYGYDEISEPVDDLPEDMMEEDDRSDSLSYGQESWASDSNADVNARFLQNLILAQMYNDKYGSAAESEEGDRWVYGEPVKVSKQKTMAKEDEDVRELKSLVRGPERDQRRDRSDKKSRKQKEDIFAAQTKPNNWDEFRSSNYKRSNDLKFSTRKTWQPATTVSPAVTSQPLRGQKEVVLPRPANPVRTPDFHQFSTRSSQREPSVFDTIKKLLHMEEQLDEEAGGSRLQKRSYIPSEESLVAQLGRLKKMA